MTKTEKIAKAETSFDQQPPWAWNHVPVAGQPSRLRSQSIVGDSEREAGIKLVASYREWEQVAAQHDIESRQHALERSKGVPAELLRREIQACDYNKWEEAQQKLDEIRKESFELAKVLYRRLVKSLSDELNQAAIEGERRLDRTGIPIRIGDQWTLHDDVQIKAIWSQRNTTEKTFVATAEHGDGVGSVQWFCTDESCPFEWVN